MPYRQNMTLLDVMILVGGLTDFADGNGAVLVRGSEGGKQYSVAYCAISSSAATFPPTCQVRPGDVLIVPQSWF